MQLEKGKTVNNLWSTLKSVLIIYLHFPFSLFVRLYKVRIRVGAAKTDNSCIE